ncbi:hypothetical protein Droror1_Dr00000564 [Drosera rotundifolia]
MLEPIDMKQSPRKIKSKTTNKKNRTSNTEPISQHFTSINLIKKNNHLEEMERDGAAGDGEGEQLTRGGGWTGEEEEEKGRFRASARRDGDGGDGEGQGQRRVC